MRNSKENKTRLTRLTTSRRENSRENSRSYVSMRENKPPFGKKKKRPYKRKNKTP